MTNQNCEVYNGIAKVREHMNREGIAKDREVTDGVRFKFRGVDNVLNEFSRPLVDAKLMTIPSYSNLVVTTRPTKNSQTYNSQVECKIQVVSLIDGSSVILGPFFGEANDTQDKSAAKAQSIAYRIGMLLSFTVPLGGDMDPEMGDSAGADSSPPTSDGKPKSRAVEGVLVENEPGQDRPMEPPSDAQLRILKQKAKTAGVSMDEIADAMGGDITRENYNRAMDWVKSRA